MSTQLRCENGILFANLTEQGVIEVKCRSRRCGAKAGVVVLHSFDPMSGRLIGTNKFKDPAEAMKEVNGNDSNAPLRTP